MNTMEFNHKMAAHCETGTLTSLLNNKGLDITEPLVFGISSGIFFGYLDNANFSFPTIIFRSRPGQIRKKISKRLGIKFITQRFKDIEKGEEALNQLIAKQLPTAAQVDFFYMNYMPEWQRVHNNVHFIIVIGKNSSKYIVSDSYYPKIAEINQDQLYKARFAGGFMAPRGFIYYPDEIKQDRIDYKPAIITGIKKACTNMLKLPVPFVGVKGIYKFANKVKTWPELVRDEEHLSHEIMKINILLEDQGTGGAGFRYMYATFLQQASEILDNKQLNELSKRMMEIGDKWRKISYFVAKIGKQRDLGENRINELSDKIKIQGDLEKKFFKDLYKTINKQK